MFFAYILNIESKLYKGFTSKDIELCFSKGVSAYTKWNPNAYPGWEKREHPVVPIGNGWWRSESPLPDFPWEHNFEIGGWGPNHYIARIKPYPAYCFDVSGKRYQDVLDLFLWEDLVQTYLKVVKRLPEFIEVACHLHQAYAETKFLAEGKKKSTTFEWDDWYLKRAALHMAWERDFCSINNLLLQHKEFESFADDLNRIRNYLEGIYPKNKSDDKLSQETFGKNKEFSQLKK